MSQKRLFLFTAAAFLIQAVVVGNIFTYSSLAPIIMRELNTTIQDATLVGSQQLAVFLACALLAVPFANHFGPSIPAAIGTALWFGGMYGLATAKEPTDPFLYLGFLAAVGGSFAYWASLSQLVRWTEPFQRVRVVGLSLLGGGVGQLVYVFVVPLFVDADNWRQTYTVISIIGGVVMLTSASFLVTPAQSTESKTWKPMVLTRNFLCLVMSTFFLMFGFFGPITMVVVDAMRYGVSYVDATRLVGYMAGGALLGRLMSIEFALCLGLLNLHRVAVCLTSVLCFTWTQSNTYTHQVAFSTMFGILSGIIATTLTLISDELWPEDCQELGNGLLLLVMVPGTLVGGSALGNTLVARDYIQGKVFISAMYCAAFVPLLMARRVRKREEVFNDNLE